MKKFIASGIAACALAVVPGVALAAPALADTHGFDPQQIHNVLETFGQQAAHGGGQQATAQGTGQQTQDADAQQPATMAQDANQAPAQGQNITKSRFYQIGFEALGLNNNAQLVELRGPADKVFNGGHAAIGQKEIGVFQFNVNPGGLPGVVHAKWNLLDANNQVNDSVEMDMVVLQRPDGQPAKLDLRNVRIEGNTGVKTRGVQTDVLGDVTSDFFRNA